MDSENGSSREFHSSSFLPCYACSRGALSPVDLRWFLIALCESGSWSPSTTTSPTHSTTQPSTQPTLSSRSLSTRPTLANSRGMNEVICSDPPAMLRLIAHCTYFVFLDIVVLRGQMRAGVTTTPAVVPDGIEPSFPACKTGVVAVGPQDCVCRSGEHVPKDLNPDLLVWNQQCYRYTRDVCLQKWERKESHLSPATTQLKAEGLQPPVWKRSQVFVKQAEAVGLEPTTV